MRSLTNRNAFGIGHDLLVEPPASRSHLFYFAFIGRSGHIRQRLVLLFHFIHSFFYFVLKIGLCFVVVWLASFLLLLGDSRCSHRLPPSSGAVLRPTTDSARGTPLSANGRRPKRSSHLLSGFVPPAKTIAGPWCGLRLKRARGTLWCHCTDEFYVSNRERSL